jgi:hypothetical protein
MKLISAMTLGILLALIQTQAHAAGDANPFRGSMSDTQEYLQLADNDDRQDRHDNVVGRTSDRINGIAARTKVMLVRTSATVKRKKSVMV